MNVDSQLLHEKLREFFGYAEFKGMQEAVIMHLLSGRNCFVLMPTGGGKSLCYQLPALIMPGTAIVVSPLIALMKNQVDAIRGLVDNKNDRIAHFLNSSLSQSAMEEVQEDLLSGKTKILYVAPESLTKKENIDFLRKINISFYAIDEAHCISEWGHDFRPEYRRIKAIINHIKPAPIIALTATATEKVRQDIKRNLCITRAKEFKASFNRPNLYYEVRDKSDVKTDLVKYINAHPGQSGIIYCLSRKKVEEVAQFLQHNHIKALPYHAGMEAAVRSANQDQFLKEEVNVIVATIAFGMGIDKPDVRFVIHYDIPKSLEGYYQETGRAGRDGIYSECIAYYSYKDVEKLEKFFQSSKSKQGEQEIGRGLISDMVSYAEGSVCRRKTLLNYFSESYKEDNCGCCDNCCHPRTKYNAKEDLTLILSLIDSLAEAFKIEHLANILAGETNSMIQSYLHDRNPFFAKGKDKSVKYWTSIIYQALIGGYIWKEIESYGKVRLTDKGRNFIAKPHNVTFTEPRVYSNYDEDDDSPVVKAPSSGVADDTLMSMLKDLRRDMARKLNLPPWIIFQDPALEEMTIKYPITIKDLATCQGVGLAKAQKFGREFVALIAKYCEQYEITRPDELIIRTTASKGDKLELIQNIVRKISLDKIARDKAWTFPELLEKLESIVRGGYPLDLDYYIEENLDELAVEEITDYFLEEAESDSIEDAIDALGADYDEDDIRLVRLQVLCNKGCR